MDAEASGSSSKEEKRLAALSPKLFSMINLESFAGKGGHLS
jgi:hypothetical protein